MITLNKDFDYYAASYSLDLYCKYDNDDHSYMEFPHQYIGETFGECAREARQNGWQIHRDRTGTCPKCAAELKRSKR